MLTGMERGDWHGGNGSTTGEAMRMDLKCGARYLAPS